MPERNNRHMVRHLKKSCECAVYPTPPFHFDATVYKPSHFPSSNTYYKPGIFYFTTYLFDRPIGIKLINEGSVDSPKVSISLHSEGELASETAAEAISEIQWRFDMNTDLTDFFLSLDGDPLLRPVLRKWRGMRVQASQSLYEYTAIACVLQNATIRRSIQMMENLFAAYGYQLAFDGHVLSCFWAPPLLAAQPEDDLRALKVGYRAKSLLKIAQDCAGNPLDEKLLRRLPKEALKKELLKLYGIGPASVWFLMFELFHHYDAMETISPWEQKIYSKLLYGQELVDREIIINEVTSRWGKWRMLAMHYVFEDLFWQRAEGRIEWLEKLIRR